MPSHSNPDVRPVPVTAFDAVPRMRVAVAALAVLALGVAAMLVPLPPGALLGTTIVLLLVATLSLRLVGVRWRDLGFARASRGRPVVFVAVGTTIVLVASSQIVLPLIQRVTGVPPDLAAFEILRGNVGALIGGLVVAWTLAAFGEELLARGFLMQVFARLLPDRVSDVGRWGTALIASSVVFGLAHAYQGPTGMLGTGFIGTGFGVAYLLGGKNLWPAILAHGLYDTVGFVAVFLGVTPVG